MFLIILSVVSWRRGTTGITNAGDTVAATSGFTSTRWSRKARAVVSLALRRTNDRDEEEMVWSSRLPAGPDDMGAFG